MRINTNVSSINAQRNLSNTQNAVSKSMAKLSSGFRINKASDDAAGLGIANTLRAETKALKQASRNAEQANSVLQIMEGSASQVQNILERMKELAAQAASDNSDVSARTKLNSEYTTLRDEMDRIVDTTKFQGQDLLKGTFGSNVTRLGTLASAADGSTLVDGTQVASTSVTTAATLQTITGGITATTSITGAALGATGLDAVTGVTVAVATQATLDTVDGTAVTFSIGAATTTVDDSAIADAAFVGISGEDGTHAPGGYTLAAVAGAGTDVDITLTGPGGANLGTVTVAEDATSITFANGLEITMDGSTNQAGMIAALNTETFSIEQEYTATVSGGGLTTQTDTLTLDGSATDTLAFSNYGITVAVDGSAVDAADLASAAISLDISRNLTLTGADASGAVTQSLAIDSSPGGDTLAFTSFGISVTLGAGATSDAIAASISGGADDLVQDSTTQAQFLVSSSGDYDGQDLVELDSIDLQSSTLGVDALDLTTASGAQAAMALVDTAIETLGTAFGDIGAAQNRIDYSLQNAKTAIENFSAAESAIRDLDMAEEMTAFSKNQILSQAGQAMLAQANQMGQGVLQLLRG